MTHRHDPRKHPGSRRVRGLAAGSDWAERCAWLFEDMWRPARSMVTRAYGRAFSDDEIRDVYSAAWAATLAALKTRGESMSDDELRSYVLTAVASHASKEMRRRARKPAGSLDEGHEQVISDGNQLLPDERVIGSEAQGVARDLLSSLPPRRRAVMLLRYGWGLKPEEVCGLVSGLSSRAYRKEVTKGVAELIERLELLESGEWCKSREPLLRDYVAGTASDDVRRQVTEHLRHCRGCSSFAAKLNSHLHELGAVGLLIASSSQPAVSATVGDRLIAAWDGARSTVAEKVDQAGVAFVNIASGGGVRGSGAIGAGAIAKLAGVGGAGKAALACIGVTAAAGACVATGVVPDVSVRGLMSESHRDAPASKQAANHAGPRELAPSVAMGRTDLIDPPTDPPPAEEPIEEPPSAEPTPEEPVPALETEPVSATPVQEEFDPMASAPAAPPPAEPAPDQPTSTGSASSPSTAGEEFGP